MEVSLQNEEGAHSPDSTCSYCVSLVCPLSTGTLGWSPSAFLQKY